MWRNLLKSDANVDLVHFTILRPPEKSADGTPINELSLIAFPVADLFGRKIKDFDLIIFDRYSSQAILPHVYLDNIVKYVREGGALLMGLMGTAGTLSIQFVLPLMGSIFDHKKLELAGGAEAFKALPPGPELDRVLGIAAQTSFRDVAALPAILFVTFPSVLCCASRKPFAHLAASGQITLPIMAGSSTGPWRSVRACQSQ